MYAPLVGVYPITRYTDWCWRQDKLFHGIVHPPPVRYTNTTLLSSPTLVLAWFSVHVSEGVMARGVEGTSKHPNSQTEKCIKYEEILSIQERRYGYTNGRECIEERYLGMARAHTSTQAHPQHHIMRVPGPVGPHYLAMGGGET